MFIDLIFVLPRRAVVISRPTPIHHSRLPNPNGRLAVLRAHAFAVAPPRNARVFERAMQLWLMHQAFDFSSFHARGIVTPSAALKTCCLAIKRAVCKGRKYKTRADVITMWEVFKTLVMGSGREVMWYGFAFIDDRLLRFCRPSLQRISNVFCARVSTSSEIQNTKQWKPMWRSTYMFV